MHRRTRIVALMSALALVAGGSVLSATVAHADAVIEFTTPADNASFVWSPTPYVFSGTTTNTDTGIDVYDYSSGGSPDLLCSATPTIGGTWSCGGTLSPRDYEVHAQQGANQDIVFFTALLPAPVVDQANPISIPYGGSALFTGTTTYPGVYVMVNAGDAGTCSDDTPVASGDPWSCSISFTGFPSGTYPVTITQEGVGNGSQTVTRNVVVGSAPVGPQIQCVFRPGGVRISSTDPDVLIAYYPVVDGEGAETSPLAPCSGIRGNAPEFIGGFGDPTYCTPQCDLFNLAPGLHNIYFSLSDAAEGGGFFGSFDHYFTVPNTPLIRTSVIQSGQILMTGSATPGDDLRIDAVGGGALCSTRVSATGGWTCRFPKSAATAARAVDIDAESRGMSAYSTSVTIPAAPKPPAAPGTPISWDLTFGSLDDLAPGDVFTIGSTGLPAGTGIEIWMHSTPVLLESTTATGAPMTFTLTVPEQIEAGAHTVEVIATSPDGTVLTREEPASVRIDAAKKTPGSDVIADHHGNVKNDVGGGSGGDGDRNDPAAPTVLTDSMATLQRIGENPLALALAAGLAIALLFLIAIPTELLNASLSSNSSRLGRGFRAVENAMDRARDWLIRVTRSRAIAAALIVLLVSITFGFVDPAFGFDLASVRLVLALAIAFFILSYGASWLSGLIIRRAWGAGSVIVLQPSIILFAILGVVVARLLDFSPGFLVGVAIGLELVRASRKAAVGAVMVQFGMIVGLSLISWVGYSLLTLGGDPTDFIGALARDTLVAIPTEGLMGAMVAIFPLRFLEGRELYDESKPLWALAFLIVATPFALLVLPTALAGTALSDVGAWLIVFAVFGALSLLVWWILARADKRDAAHAEAEAEATPEKPERTRAKVKA